MILHSVVTPAALASVVTLSASPTETTLGESTIQLLQQSNDRGLLEPTFCDAFGS